MPKELVQWIITNEGVLHLHVNGNAPWDHVPTKAIRVPLNRLLTSAIGRFRGESNTTGDGSNAHNATLRSADEGQNRLSHRGSPHDIDLKHVAEVLHRLPLGGTRLNQDSRTLYVCEGSVYEQKNWIA
jgi:hypothetical protein